MYETENDISKKRRSELNALMNQRPASAIDLPNQIVFMSKTASSEIRPASRPNGIPTAASFTLAHRTGAAARSLAGSD